MFTRLLTSALLLLLAAGSAYLIFQAAAQLASPGLGNALRGAWRNWLIRPLVNPLRRAFGLLPVCVLPLGTDAETLRHWLDQAKSLIRQARDALRHNPHIPRADKAELRRQMDKLPDNLVALSWKLARLRELQEALADSPENQREVERMAARLLQEMANALHVLQAIPVSLLKLELAEEQPEVARLAEDMRESNQRMRELVQAQQRAYQDISGGQT